MTEKEFLEKANGPGMTKKEEAVLRKYYGLSHDDALIPKTKPGKPNLKFLRLTFTAANKFNIEEISKLSPLA